MQSLSVIIPVYNGSASLPDLVRRLEAALPSLSSAHELILVNDASLDQSWQVIERLTQDHEWVHGINLARNYGQHNALLCGIREAQGDIIVTLDDDLQHPPEELPRLLEALQENTDVVYGTPVREQHGLWRILASRVSKIVLQRAMGAEAARSISAFRPSVDKQPSPLRTTRTRSSTLTSCCRGERGTSRPYLYATTDAGADARTTRSGCYFDTQ